MMEGKKTKPDTRTKQAPKSSRQGSSRMNLKTTTIKQKEFIFEGKNRLGRVRRIVKRVSRE